MHESRDRTTRRETLLRAEMTDAQLTEAAQEIERLSLHLGWKYDFEVLDGRAQMSDIVVELHHRLQLAYRQLDRLGALLGEGPYPRTHRGGA